LDASKTGLRVKQHVFDEDRHQWGAKKPWYTWKLEQAKGVNNNNKKACLKRQGSLFILDALVEEGESLRNQMLQKYRALRTRFPEEDKDLSKPWLEAKAKAAQARTYRIDGFSINLEDIEAHVDEAFKGYQRAVAISGNKSAAESSFSRDAHYEKVAHGFADTPKFRGFLFFSDDDVQILKASLACTKSLSFGFSVAFNTLCTIKARAQAGGHATMVQQFVQCMSIPGVVSRTFSRLQTQGDDT
jgi:RNA-dependent RNA polymerase